MFSLDFNNKLILDVYENDDNYKIISGNENSNKILVVFSSNALYYPNTENEFLSTIIKNDRYEGKDLCNSRIVKREYNRIVLLRDVYKAHYQVGISKRINSFCKIAELIRSLAEGRDVVCYGGSAGGYAALVVGLLIGAKYIYCNSPQVNLFVTDYVNSHPIIKSKYQDNFIDYFDLTELIKKSNTIIFYFFPCLCEQDVIQYNVLSCEKIENLYFYPICSALHGDTLDSKNYPYVLTMNVKKLIDLSGKEYGKKSFFVNSTNMYIYVLSEFLKLIKKCKSLFKLYGRLISCLVIILL